MNTSVFREISDVDPFYIDVRHRLHDAKLNRWDKRVLQAFHTAQQNLERVEEKRRVRDTEFLTSRMADREFSEGEELFLGDGVHSVGRIVAEDGAYVAVLLPKAESAIPKLVCRGTMGNIHSTEGLQSVLNDFQLEIGVAGVDAVFAPLRTYLEELGCREIDICGKSLGGAHAQMLTVFFAHASTISVRRLTTHCSVGVVESVHRAFSSALKERTSPLEIIVVRNGGDHVEGVDQIPLVGGAHLGYGINSERVIVKVLDLFAGEAGEECSISLSSLEKTNVLAVIKSFWRPHHRQVTLGDFRVSAAKDLDTALQAGSLQEWPRKIVALLAYLPISLAFGRLYQRSFVSSLRRHKVDRL